MSPASIDDCGPALHCASLTDSSPRCEKFGISHTTFHEQHLPIKMSSPHDHSHKNTVDPKPSSSNSRKSSRETRSTRRSRLGTERADAMIIDCTRTLSPAQASVTTPATQTSAQEMVASSGSFLDALKASKPSLMSRMHANREKENLALPLTPSSANPFLPATPITISLANDAPLPKTTNQAAADHVITLVSGPSYSVESRLVMKLCEEIISYDLESLEKDPKAIIELLKVTASERDKWIVVACHYRRKGDVEAAISVVTCMVEVMTGHGMSEQDLNPAFLMLSSCETELSKRGRTTSGQETDNSKEHAQKSYTWLQKVYAERGPRSERPTPLTSCLIPKSTIKSTNQTSDHSRYATSSKPSEDHVGRSDVYPLPNYKPTAEVTNDSRIQALENQIQSLRDREKIGNSQFAAIRSAKRKIEDDFDAERNLRKKFERRLNDMEGKLDVSKKMENFALDQMKREVDARRRAEERAENERERRKGVEASLNSRSSTTGRPLFEDLADMFQRAAKGEGMILPASATPGSSKKNRGSER